MASLGFLHDLLYKNTHVLGNVFYAYFIAPFPGRISQAKLLSEKSKTEGMARDRLQRRKETPRRARRPADVTGPQVSVSAATVWKACLKPAENKCPSISGCGFPGSQGVLLSFLQRTPSAALMC